MGDRETIRVYDELVEDYLAFVEQEPVDPLLLRFINSLEPGDYVLDLGCGPGISAATMCKHGLAVDPVDASPVMVKQANQQAGVTARIARFEDINADAVYHAVWANFSLLHATADELPGILKNLRRAVVPGGIFHLAMKTGRHSKRDRLGRFYSYYSPAELYRQLAAAGFEVMHSDFGEGPGLAGEIEPWIAITSQAVTDTSQP